MRSNVSGIIGGIIGGLIKLGLDQITYAIGISAVDTVGTFSMMFFGGPQYFAVWIIYLAGSGLIGWLVATLIPGKYSDSYITTGIIAGIILWGVMNVIFAVADIATPTWSLGIGGFIINLATHIILGISITYAVWGFKSRRVSNENFNRANFNTETASEINPFSYDSNTNENSINNTKRNNSSQTCIDACMKCAQACFECISLCLKEPDSKARANCIKVLTECAEMCQMSATTMSMNGKSVKEHCNLCAEICKQCAKECEMFKDDHCKKCADICNMCADECRKMAAM